MCLTSTAGQNSFGQSVTDNEVHDTYDILPETRYISLHLGHSDHASDQFLKLKPFSEPTMCIHSSYLSFKFKFKKLKTHVLQSVEYHGLTSKSCWQSFMSSKIRLQYETLSICLTSAAGQTFTQS